MIKKGLKLIATNECVMKDSLEPTLTIGKKYKVKSVSDKLFEISNDRDEPHYFKVKKAYKYFKISKK